MLPINRLVWAPPKR